MAMAVPPSPALLALHPSFFDPSLLFWSSSAVGLLAWLRAGEPWVFCLHAGTGRCFAAVLSLRITPLCGKSPPSCWTRNKQHLPAQ